MTNLRATLVIFLVAAAPAAGFQPGGSQAQTTSPPAGTAAPSEAKPPADPSSAKPAAPVTGSLRGVVVNSEGLAQPGAVVRLLTVTPKASSSGVSQTKKLGLARVANERGEYAFESLEPGVYTLDVLGAQEVIPSDSRRITVDAGQATTVHLSHAAGATAGWAPFAAALAFLVLMVLFRRYNIAAPARELLRAQMKGISASANYDIDRTRWPEVTAHVADGAREVDGLMQRELSPTEWLFWSNGRELAAWTLGHAFERQLVKYFEPALVVERARIAEADLRAMPNPCIVLAEGMRSTLTTLSIADTDAATADAALQRLRQQLAEALGAIYDARDTKFAALIEWQNKAMWMVVMSLASIVGLASTFGDAGLFLIGAAGGLMSRMARSMFREDVPTDYGASWTTLFLSPLIGALGAWFGLAIIVVLTSLGMLGGVFANVRWGPVSYDALTVGLAFVLGFSERLFRSLLSAVEGRATADVERAKAAPVAVPPSPPSPLPQSLPSVPAGGGAAPSGLAAAAAERIIQELDVRQGERAVFIGDASSASRLRLQKEVEAVKAAGFAHITLEQLANSDKVDAVLLEKALDVAELPAVAKAIEQALNRAGRLVVVNSTPAGLFEADADTLRKAKQAGPGVVRKDVNDAGLLSREPPERIDGPDPVRWSASFVKP